MANEKFTPEPWHVQYGSQSTSIYAGKEWICEIGSERLRDDANAALIAAAPAMYQKLTHLATVLESLESSLRLGTLRPIIEDTEKLLAAARGEEQTTTNKTVKQ